jgi:prephenate dehydrogenase
VLRKLAIVGPGLLGRSVALAARRAQPELVVAEIDRGQALDAVRDADLVVLSAPVDVILEILTRHADLLLETTTIDTGSTKAQIVAAARAAGLEHFVGGHPMAGAATTGSDGARADLFEGRPWFLVSSGASAGALARAQAFVSALGAVPVVLADDGAEHDRVMAAVSHLPQVVVSALMVVVARAAGERLGWAGSGLRDTTRLADSPGPMWASILQTNAKEVAPLLVGLADELTRLAGVLDRPAAIDELFAEANRWRAYLRAGASPES